MMSPSVYSSSPLLPYTSIPTLDVKTVSSSFEDYKKGDFVFHLLTSVSGCYLTEDLPGANTYSQTEATGNDAHQNALATSTQVATLHKQQTSLIQSNPQTNLDLWNTTVGYGFHFKHRNHRTLPI
jgi:hypothetical protein